MGGHVRVGGVELVVVQRDGGEVTGPHDPAVRLGQGPVGVQPADLGDQFGHLSHAPTVSPPGRLDQAAAGEDLGTGQVDRPGLDRLAGLGGPLEHPHGDAAQGQFGRQEHADRARPNHYHVHVHVHVHVQVHVAVRMTAHHVLAC